MTTGASWNTGSTGALRPLKAQCCDALVMSALGMDRGGHGLCSGDLFSTWVWRRCALTTRRQVSELASELAMCSPTCPTSVGLISSVRACSLQSCPILCEPLDCSSPGSSVHGILHARIPEWVARHSCRGSS